MRLNVRLVIDPRELALAVPQTRRVVEPLEPEPAPVVRRHGEGVAVEQDVGEADARAVRERGQRRRPQRSREVQVQVRFGQGRQVTHVASLPGAARSGRQRPSHSGRGQQPPLERHGHGPGAVVHAELGEDPQQVRLHGRLADEELGTDLRVGAAPCHGRQHLELP